MRRGENSGNVSETKKKNTLKKEKNMRKNRIHLKQRKKTLTRNQNAVRN